MALFSAAIFYQVEIRQDQRFRLTFGGMKPVQLDNNAHSKSFKSFVVIVFNNLSELYAVPTQRYDIHGKNNSNLQSVGVGEAAEKVTKK